MNKKVDIKIIAPSGPSWEGTKVLINDVDISSKLTEIDIHLNGANGNMATLHLVDVDIDLHHLLETKIVYPRPPKNDE
jgi:hypothetical protein